MAAHSQFDLFEGSLFIDSPIDLEKSWERASICAWISGVGPPMTVELAESPQPDVERDITANTMQLAKVIVLFILRECGW